MTGDAGTTWASSHLVRPASSRRALRVALATSVLLFAATARAQEASSEEGEAPASIMSFLARRGLHDLERESWNLYGQLTSISHWKLPFHAAYTNAGGSVNSLVPGYEYSYTGTFTLFFGKSLWTGAEGYFVPEVIAERPLSQLRGIGGAIQNFELQKTGVESPQVYRARTFLRQTFDLGGSQTVRPSAPMQLGTTVARRRLVLTVGTFTALDVFDKNNVTGDPRQTFLNMAFMTHPAWDFASDARGYSLGAALELYWDDWALRLGRMSPPRNPNTLPLELRLWKYYGDALEIEHGHVLLGQPGAVRVLAYRNYEVIGRFDEAIASYRADPNRNAAACTGFNYGSTNATAPDLCWARRPNQKLGIGINVEQLVARDLGVFLRAMYADGLTEVGAFDPADRSLNFGAVARGGLWDRPLDVTGIGYGISWISDIHAQYLAMGGVDGFVGDGGLRQATERIFEVFYSVNVLKTLWVTADYQFLWNPGFNADRGPVTILGARVHAEF